MNAIDLAKLNSMTKYPSISTYHSMDDKGRLQEKLNVEFVSGEQLEVTEKIDGTNSRIIFPYDHQLEGDPKYLLGSREELLHARGDIIYNPAQSIVDITRPYAERMLAYDSARVALGVAYVESFGAKTTAGAKQYTSGDASLRGVRLFDVLSMPYDEAIEVMRRTPEEIARWRDGGGQPFLNATARKTIADAMDAALVPTLEAKDLPRSIADTYEWLKATITMTKAHLGGGEGLAEGVVVRTPDRQKIVKIRFEDYERVLRKNR